jgi:hypothetical protein
MTTKTAKAFTKGDTATMIGDWDGKGTFYVRDVLVYACGNKSMTLCNATGSKCIGKDFAPIRGDEKAMSAHRWYGVFPRMTTEEANAKALELAGQCVILQRAFYEGRKEQFAAACASYHAAIDKDISELHEARVIAHPERFS